MTRLCGHSVRHRCGWCSGSLCPFCCWRDAFANEWRLIGAAASVRPLPMPRELDDEDRMRRTQEGEIGC